uniref:PX domain-containing protein n=1 Tax=Elaeophora elaphi TaxID=1147741 RepID=A0A0R3RGQ2_9BILA
MPVLLRDVSACNNDLGRILYTNPEEWTVFMEIVSTNTLSSYFSSHIEYRMTINAILNSSVVDTRCFDMWTRFRDVKRLWKQLAALHKMLHLHGSFPQFAEAVIFGNQNAQIMGERTSSITTFLNYVLAHPILRQSKVLHDYFAKASEIEKPSKQKDPLDPTQQFPSNGESFTTNLVHVLHCKPDSSILLIAEHENSQAPSPPEQTCRACPISPAEMQENALSNTQENNAANAIPPAMVNQTSPSQFSYLLPTYHCVASRSNEGPLQRDYS